MVVVVSAGAVTLRPRFGARGIRIQGKVQAVVQFRGGSCGDVGELDVARSAAMGMRGTKR